MARIGTDELERLKAEVSLVRVAEASGVRLERRGREWVGSCPFHEDDTPSFSISEVKNLWRCFGACDAGGDVVSFVTRKEGVSFRHAVELLREGYGSGIRCEAVGEPSSSASLPSTASARPVTRSTVPKLPPAVKASEDTELLEEVTAFYHGALAGNADAMAYLDKRGLGDPALIAAFSLGVADRTLGYRLPAMNRKAGAEVRGRLQTLGVLRETGHEHLRGSLIVPLMDATGRVVNLYGRKLRDDLRPGTPDHLYLPGPHRGVFNAAGIAGAEEAILCEALIDAMTFWAAGFRHVTACYGTGGMTEEIWQVLGSAKRVLIAFDRDEAGDRGAEKIAAECAARGIAAYRVQFPRNMDANQYALAVKPASQSLGTLLRSAEWMAGAGKTRPKIAIPDSEGVDGDERLRVKESPPLSAAPPEASSGAASPAAALSSSLPSSLPASLPASPVPPPSSGPSVARVDERGDAHLMFGDRAWRMRGLDRNPVRDVLKLNLTVRRGEAFHADTLDLYAARARAAFAAEAALELGVGPDVVKRDLGQVLFAMETLQDKRLTAAAAPASSATATSMTPEEREAALAFLRSPDLLERIAADIADCGVVGEKENAQAVYLAALSRKLDRPLAVLVQSTSAAGKSALMDAVLDLAPPEDRIAYSAMTGQSVFYLGGADLKHKVLSIAEEEGARQASYALKLLQSQGSLTIASTGKDPASGRHVTQEYTVEGPVALMMTTTAAEIDEELRNRCLVLSVDESRAQTRAIHARQRRDETLAGLMHGARAGAIRALHHRAQRLLEPVQVVNPFADRLGFRDDQTRMRRDHRKYLGLIRVIAFLHQHQREVRHAEQEGAPPMAYIEATRDDIRAANRLAHAVMGSTLDDVPPQTRRLLGLILGYVQDRVKKEGVRASLIFFSRRELREATGWGDTQLKVHLSRLDSLEYVLARRDGGRNLYELAWSGEGEDGSPFVTGLIDPAEIAEAECSYAGKRAGSGRAMAGGKSASSRKPDSAPYPGKTVVIPDQAHQTRQTHDESGGDEAGHSPTYKHPIEGHPAQRPTVPLAASPAMPIASPPYRNGRDDHHRGA